MRVTSKGQVTIPQEVREKLGLLPATEVEFVVEGNTARLRRVGKKTQDRGLKAVARLRGRASVRLSTDEIMKLTRQP